MKKTIFTIALTALMILVSSGINRGDNAIKIGEMAPEISLNTPTDTISLNQMRGQYVLLNFWSSTDAKSRIENSQLSSWYFTHRPENLKQVSVNFDTEPLLFEEMAKRDNLNAETQYNVNGINASRITNLYQLNQGYGSLLIDPEGRIAKIKPDAEYLSSIFS